MKLLSGIIDRILVTVSSQTFRFDLNSSINGFGFVRDVKNINNSTKSDALKK